ncbi:MAG: SusC/RagA family TonB-linked outer membrane protein [Mangrovibacterium sp.]
MNDKMNLMSPISRKILCGMMCFLFLLCSSITAHAQGSRTVTGIVTSASDGSTIPGASVIVEGTTSGVVTDINGTYTISAAVGAKLHFNFVGFTEQVVEVATQSKIDVILVSSMTELDDVVVVGYGVQQKKLVTGATTQVDGDAIAKQSATNALQAMQGQTPGVQISSTSGQPGEGMNIRIRGLGTIGNSGPLYVVDGVQTGGIDYLNPSDIESIDILKDAASAAIYGSQAANGVILVTTKKGSVGKINLTFDAYYGVQNPARQVRMLNAKEYAVIQNESNINSGAKPYFTQSQIDALGDGTDWLDEMFYQNAVTQNYSLGLSGGNKVSVFSSALSYTGQEGIVGGPDVSNYDRINFRINSDHKLFDGFLTFGQHLTFNYTTQTGISVGNQYNNTLRSAFGTSPFLPVYDDNGDYMVNMANSGVMVNGEEWTPWNEGESNPYANMMLNGNNVTESQKLFGDVYAEIAPIKNLKIRTRLGFDLYTAQNRSYKPEYQLSIYNYRLNDQASQNMSKTMGLTWDNYATYDFTLGADHNFSAMLGTSAYRSTGMWMYGYNSNLIISDWDHAWINNATNQSPSLMDVQGAPNDENMLLSYFGRLSYNFKEKYLFNATFRADGSSKFDENNRWGYFPSFSAGWVMTNESWAASVTPVMEYFKLRVSWGQVGNQNISAFQYLAPISVGAGSSSTDDSYYYFGDGEFAADGNAIGAYPSRLGNPDIRWEVSEQTNIGFDARFLQGRLGANFDWYKKVTKDWLLEKPGYASDGSNSPYFNGGDVTNTGVELALNWTDKIGAVNYFVSANMSYNKNEVTSVPTEDGIVHGGTGELYDNATEFYRRAEVGRPIGYFWGYETDGVFQNKEQVANYKNADGKVIQPTAKPGDIIYKDLDGNGSINDNDKTMVGDPNPDVTFGFNIGLDYKGFDFAVQANGVAGNQLVQSYRNHADNYANYTTAILDRWHGEGTSNKLPRVTNTNVNYQFSDIFVQDGDFLRISNVTLGYDFAKSVIKNNLFSQCRVYFSAQNLLTFTKYDGMDPEIGYGLESGSSGIDLGYYPRPRTLMLGVNLKF